MISSVALFWKPSIFVNVEVRKFIMKFLFLMGAPSRCTPSVSSDLVISFVVSRVGNCCCLLVRNCLGEMPLVEVRILHLSGRSMHPKGGP